MISAEAQAALDKSLAALSGGDAPPAAGGGSVGVAPDAGSRSTPTGPLRFDGVYWTRQPGPTDVDPYDQPLPVTPIDVGWWVHSVSQLSESGVGSGRHGLCVAREGDDEGQALYVCAEDYRSALGRLVIGIDDVAYAGPGTAKEARRLADKFHSALGLGKTRYRLSCERSWALGVAVTLEQMAAA